MTRLDAGRVRREFSETINRVAKHGERVVLKRRGKDVAAIVPVGDLRLLDRLIRKLEDRLDLREAERRLADPGEKPIPYHKARKDLGLA